MKEPRMKLIEFLITLYLLSVPFLTPVRLAAQELNSPSMSYEEWQAERSPNKEGKLKPDPIMKLPEISTLFGVGKGGKIAPAIGIEIFHDRTKPRRHKWKFEIQIAEEELSVGVSRIIVPVVNFTIGPYYGYDFGEDDKTFGVRLGIFKF